MELTPLVDLDEYRIKHGFKIMTRISDDEKEKQFVLFDATLPAIAKVINEDFNIIKTELENNRDQLGKELKLYFTMNTSKPNLIEASIYFISRNEDDELDTFNINYNIFGFSGNSEKELSELLYVPRYGGDTIRKK